VGLWERKGEREREREREKWTGERDNVCYVFLSGLCEMHMSLMISFFFFFFLVVIFFIIKILV
jgi:hypothetical protein